MNESQRQPDHSCQISRPYPAMSSFTTILRYTCRRSRCRSFLLHFPPLPLQLYVHQTLYLMSINSALGSVMRSLTQALHNVRGPIGPRLHSGVSVAPQPKQLGEGLILSPEDVTGLFTGKRGDLGRLSSAALDSGRDVCPEMLRLPSDASWTSDSNASAFASADGGVVEEKNGRGRM